MKHTTRIIAAALMLLFATAVNAQQAKYIFYFIGDGMGPGHVMLTDTYKRQALGDTAHLNMLSLPVQSFVTTYSASSPVTDSAAAGTALSTGSKTKNSMLGMNADTVAVTSIAKYLHDNGYGVALMTNVPADDATPGAFYAHVPSRRHYYDIGRQYADCGYELLAGAALRGVKDKKGNPTDLMDYIASKNIEVVGDIADVARSDNRRIILLPTASKWDWDMGYTVDNVPGIPTVADMTDAAIRHLSRHTPERFFMMIEGGNIDHCGHSNDGGAVVKETLAFDNAIARALEFYADHPFETLIVITADHETGGLSVGTNTTRYNARTQYFVPQKMSKDVFSDYCDNIAKTEKKPTWEEMKQTLADNFGFFTIVPVKEDKEKELQEAFTDTFINGNTRRQETLYSDFNPFAVDVFMLLNEAAGAGWTTLHHSGNFVPLFAIGVGSEQFKGHNDNTDIPKKILRAAGVSHR